MRTMWMVARTSLGLLVLVGIVGANDAFWHARRREVRRYGVQARERHPRRDLETILVHYDDEAGGGGGGITTTMLVGAPAQSLQLVVDTGSADTFFYGSDGEINQSVVAWTDYAPGRSTSAVEGSTFFQIKFAADAAATRLACQAYTDVMTLTSWPLLNGVSIQGSASNLTIPAQSFGVCNVSDQGQALVPATNISGLLGLAFPGLAYDRDGAGLAPLTFMQNIAALTYDVSLSTTRTDSSVLAAKNLTRPVFAIRYPQSSNETMTGGYGSLVFGGVDTTLYQGDIYTLAVEPIPARPASGTGAQASSLVSPSSQTAPASPTVSSASSSVSASAPAMSSSTIGLSYPSNTPLEAQTYWQVRLAGITLNGSDISKLPSFAAVDHYAVLDTGSSAIYAPPDVLQELFAMVPGAMESDTAAQDGFASWTLPCATRDALTLGLVFTTMDGQNVTFEVPGSDLVAATASGVTLPAQGGTREILCASYLVGANSSVPTSTITNGYFLSNGNTTQGIWVLGSRFLKNVYAVYDFGGGRGGSVGLARLSNNTNVWINQNGQGNVSQSLTFPQSSQGLASLVASSPTTTATTVNAGLISPFPVQAQTVVASVTPQTRSAGSHEVHSGLWTALSVGLGLCILSL